MSRSEDKFFDERAEHYDSWSAYCETVERHQQGGRSTADRGAFLPDPDEIEVRIAMLRELQGHGFNERFIASIMQHDTPTISVVRVAVARCGPRATWLRYRNFLETTEYDDEH